MDPSNKLITFFNFLSILHFKESTIRNVIGNEHTALLLIHNSDFTGTAHHYLARCLPSLISCFDHTDTFEFKNTGELRFDVCFNSNV